MMLAASSGRLDNFLQFLGALCVFLFVLALTYFVTRWIGSYQKSQLSTKNMQVLETMHIANNKYIQIVRVSEEYLVISITKDHVELLTKLGENSIASLHKPEEVQPLNFQEILKKLKVNKK